MSNAPCYSYGMRDTTPTYVLHLFDGKYAYTPSGWSVKRDGRPTAANLATAIRSFENSTQPGGANAHLGATRILRATIKRNVYGGETVATYEAR